MNVTAPQLKEGNIYLGSLTHSGQLDFKMSRVFYSFASQERAIMSTIQQSSLLAAGCNHLWCDALNNRERHNLKWFVLLHADIAPEQWFVDKMIDIAEKNDADLLSAVVPIKNMEGITSTALSGPDSFTRLTRLTMKQIQHPNFPKTFDWWDAFNALSCKLPEDLRIEFPEEGDVSKKPFLLVNTGCMVCRLDRPWSHQAYFTINDRIVPGMGGTFKAEVEPEDWFFSRRVAELGGKVMATSEITLEHVGSMAFYSNRVWGLNVDSATLRRV